MELHSILNDLVQIAGAEHVLVDDATLEKYSASLVGTFVKPLCVVFPGDTESVVEIVKLANKLKFCIYPVSKGKNMGYGDAQGTSAQQVIIDFGRMNNILEVNPKLSYASIQPGVTQQQLYTHLKSGNYKLQLDVTGAGLDASILGNVLERGFGHTDYADRFSKLINMTVVTPEGNIIKTGFGDFDKPDAGQVYRYGFGPVLDGIFSQSNFGIVTEITFELMPIPESTVMFVFSTTDASDLKNMVSAVREMKLAGIVNSAIHIANKSRAVGEKENKFVGAWNMSGAISGSKGMVSAKKRELKKILKKHLKHYKLWIVDERLIRTIGWIDKNVKNLPVYVPLRDIFNLQKGVPTDGPLKTLLNDESVNSKTISFQNAPVCFSWINAVCKADEDSVSQVVDLLSTLFSKHGYEFRVTLTAISPRAYILISNISYPANEEAIKKAEQFCRFCAEQLNANGFYPYRSGSGLYDKLPAHSETYANLLSKLKTVFDPNNILAPGKYNIDK